MRAVRAKRTFRFTITFHFIMVFAILLPPNYLGMPIRPNFNADKGFKIWNKAEANRNSNKTENMSDGTNGKSNTGHLFVLGAFTLFVLLFSSFMYGAIVSFLNAQPTTRQCLLIYLYKDLTKLILAKVWLVSLELIWYNVNEERVRRGVSELEGIIIACYTLTLNLAIILGMNFISFHKLLISTSKYIDPFIVYFGYDDEIMIKVIRYSNSGFSIAFTTLVSLLDVHTTKYYHLVGRETTFQDLPTGSIAILVLQAAIVLMWAISYSTSKMVGRCCTPKRVRYFVSPESISSTGPINTTENTETQTILSIPTMFLSTFFSICILLIVALLIVLFGIVDCVPYIRIQQILIGLLLPILMASKNTALRFYIKRTTFNQMQTISIWYQTFRVASNLPNVNCQRRPATVEPIT